MILKNQPMFNSTLKTYLIVSASNFARILLVFLLLLSAVSLKAQVSIWSENFSSYTRGTTNGSSGGVGWSCFIKTSRASWTNSDYNSVRNGQVVFRKSGGGDYVWETSSIDASAYSSIKLSIELVSSKNVEGNESISFYYSTDGGSSYSLFSINGQHRGPVNSAITASHTLGATANLKLKVVGQGFDWNDVYRFKNVLVAGSSENSYCNSYGSSGYNFGISSVSFNTIDNNTNARSGYNDYTGLTTDVIPGNQYAFDVEIGTYSNNRMYARAWVDWNHNGSFVDSGEEYDLGSSSVTGRTNLAPLNIVVPVNAVEGTTRLRVISKYSRYPSSCERWFYGEVEDYTLNVLPKQPIVQLRSNESSIGENGGTAQLIATLDQKSMQAVTVNLIFSGGAPSVDYNCPNQIVIPAGSLSSSIVLTAVNNDVNDADRDVTVDISGVVNAIEGGVQQETITIVDDDIPSTDPIEIDNKNPESTYSPNELVQNVLVTGCLTADNVTYSGDVFDGIGFFEAGTSDFPLKSGIILSTGDVDNAPGPSSNLGDDGLDNDASDSDINTLTRNNSRDAQVLEFDFVPAGNKLEFRYVFASEEYPGYACSGYNDVFAFILSGPGIVADPGLSGKNIAIIPGTSDNVSINNVYDPPCDGHPDNSGFYENESGGSSIVFNGRTVVLTAEADVTACETYNIRLIISDVGDSRYNSAVFLEAESFKTNEVVIKNGLGDSDDLEVMYEGCDNSFLQFTREDNLDEDFTFDITISGTAENGVDFVQTNASGDELGVFPSQITIPANETEVTYYYKAISDALREGDEYFRLSFLKGCPCSSTPEYYTKDITIIDVPEIEATVPSNVQCLSGTPVATLTVEMKNLLDPTNYEYSLDGGAYQNDNVFTITNPVVGSLHTVSVQDKFSCNPAAEFSVTIPEVVPIEANAGSDKSMCEGETIQLSGSGGIFYEWSCSPASGLAYLNNINASNPTVDENIPFGIYTYTLTVKESSSSSAFCVSTDDMILTVKENSHFTIASNQSEYCSGETINLSSAIINSQAGDTYLWTPSGNINNPNAANTSAVFNTVALVAKDFSLTVTKSNGCSNTENITGLIINPHPIASLNASSNICADINDGQLNIDVSGGTPFGSNPLYTYSWSHNAALNNPNATGLSSGSYTITVTDAKNCSTVETFEVSQTPRPIGVFHD